MKPGGKFVASFGRGRQLRPHMIRLASALIPLLAVIFLPVSGGLAAQTGPGAHPGPIRLSENLRDYPIGLHTEYLVDSTGSLGLVDIRNLGRGLDDAAASPGSPVWRPGPAELPAFGFSSGTYWVRFSLENPSDLPQPWYLELAYPLIDEIDMYIPTGSAAAEPTDLPGYRLLKRGDLRPFAQRDVQHRNIVFPLEVAPGRGEYYARIQTSSAVNVYLSLWQPDDFLDTVYAEQLVIGLYYGVMVVMALYNLFLFVFVVDRSYLYYALYIIGYTLYQATLNGLSFQYLWPASIWWANNCLPLFMAFGSMWGLVFTRSFLNTRGNNRYVDRALLVFITINAVNMPLAMLLPYELIIKIATATIALSVLLIYAAGLRSLMVGFKPSRYFLIAWTMLIFGIFVFALKSFGILPSNFVTNWSQQIGSAAEVLLLSLALADRINIIKKEKEAAQLEAIESLRKADALKDEFLARTSHELKTPLNGIIGLAEGTVETVRRRQAIPRRTFYENMDMVISSGRRLSALVNDILDFSRLKNADIELRLQPVDAGRVLQLVATLSQPLLNSSQSSIGDSNHAPVAMRIECPDDLPLVLADEDRLQQILLNLVGNAIKFTHQGEIVLGARQITAAPGNDPAVSAVGRSTAPAEFRNDFKGGDAPIEIFVRDSGIGIPLEKQEQIFESFQQAEDSIAREYGGTGLGLAIVRSLVGLHGSRVTLASEAGRGSTFAFRLPIARQDLAAAEYADDLNVPAAKAAGDQDLLYGGAANHAIAGVSMRSYALPAAPVVTTGASVDPLTARGDSSGAPAPVPGASGASSGNAPKILCVDDEPVNLRVLETMLASGNFEVFTAADGPTALNWLAENQPDLILLDLMMPRMSGFEVIRRIREEHSASLLPVIILSAKNQVTDLVQGLNLGANDYLTKPFSREELFARMSVHLDLRASIRSHMRQARAFQRFVPTEFLNLLGRKDVSEIEHGDSSQLRMSVLFSDIRAFTALAENLSVDDNFKFLNDYLNRMVPDILKHGGFVDKFIGDAIMALFPELMPADDAVASASGALNGEADGAIRAALAMRAALRVLNAERAVNGLHAIDFGIGINTGDLMIGTVGTRRRLDTTVIGDTVNLASRLQSLTGLYGVPLLISDHTLRSLKNPDAFATREVDSVTVKGKKVPVVIYEVYESDEAELRAAKDANKSDFTRGIILYKSREFTGALEIFDRIVRECPGDPVAALYVRRCREYLEHPPAESWQGVVDLQQK